MVLLCIDDDHEDVEMFQEAIRIIDESSRCVIASNGKEALARLETIVPDYIFLDINMPVMDGKETLRRIRRDNRLRYVPVCILSTSRDKLELELCRALGATNWLTKPSSFAELVRLIKLVIRDIQL